MSLNIDWGSTPLSPSCLTVLTSITDTSSEITPLSNCFFHLISEAKKTELYESKSRFSIDYLILDHLSNFSSDEEVPTVSEEGIKCFEEPTEKSITPSDVPVNKETIKKMKEKLKLIIQHKRNYIEIKEDLENIKTNDLDSIIKEVWECNLKEEERKYLIKIIPLIEHNSQYLWRQIILPQFQLSKQDDFTSAVELLKQILLQNKRGVLESFILPVVLTLNNSEVNDTEILRNLVELLELESKAELLRIFLQALKSDVNNEQLSTLITLLEATDLNKQLVEDFLEFLNSRIVPMKHNRNMGLLLLMFIQKMSFDSYYLESLKSVSSRYLGVMRFRIAKSLKELENKS